MMGLRGQRARHVTCTSLELIFGSLDSQEAMSSTLRGRPLDTNIRERGLACFSALIYPGGPDVIHSVWPPNTGYPWGTGSRSRLLEEVVLWGVELKGLRGKFLLQCFPRPHLRLQDPHPEVPKSVKSQ